MKTALITGGASGLGKVVSEVFAKQGYNLLICYNTHENEAQKLKEDLNKLYSTNVEIVKCDISKEEEINDLMQKIKEKNQNIDVLINNAALCLDSLYEEKTKDNFMKTLEVNLVGTFLMSRFVGDFMYEQQKGSIINITSTNGIDKYFPMSLDYDASKAGLISLTHNLALQYAPFIRVNAVAPGWVKTENEMKDLDEEYISYEEEKIFLKRFGEPEEIAKVIFFLASDDASYINNTVIRVDGGVY